MKNKKIIAILGTAVILSGTAFTSITSMAATPHHQTKQVVSQHQTSASERVVTASGLNVRAKASVNSSRLGILTKGTKVNVLAQEGNWSKISFNGKTAYVDSTYLSSNVGQTNYTQTAKAQEKVVTASGLNVRAKASINSSRLGILTKGTKVNVLAQEGNWSKISFNGKTAYVDSTYLSSNVGHTTSSTQASKAQEKIVTASGLNVRAKASVNSSRLGILTRGSKVNVLAQEGNWSKISFNGKTAYVDSTYLSSNVGHATSSTQASKAQEKVVTASGLNVRAKASVNSSRLGILRKGTKVNVLAQEGNWSKISFNGKTAYVDSTYLSSNIGHATSSTQASKAQEKVVTANGLSVRAKASVNSSRLGILQKGKKITVLAQEGNWSKISFNGKTAFVSSQYLK